MRQIGSFAVDTTAGEKMRKHRKHLQITGEVMGPVAIDSKLTWGERALLTALHDAGENVRC